VAGIGGGLFGLWYIHRRDRRRPTDSPSAEERGAGT
jgi:hypothetical protein